MPKMIGWAALEGRLYRRMLRWVEECEKAEDTYEKIAVRIAAETRAEFKRGRNSLGSEPDALIGQRVGNDPEWQDWHNRAKWTADRATMYATTLQAAIAYRLRGANED